MIVFCDNQDDQFFPINNDEDIIEIVAKANADAVILISKEFYQESAGSDLKPVIVIAYKDKKQNHINRAYFVKSNPRTKKMKMDMDYIDVETDIPMMLHWVFNQKKFH